MPDVGLSKFYTICLAGAKQTDFLTAFTVLSIKSNQLRICFSVTYFILLCFKIIMPYLNLSNSFLSVFFPLRQQILGSIPISLTF